MNIKLLLAIIGSMIASNLLAQTDIYVWKNGVSTKIEAADSITHEVPPTTYELPNGTMFKMIYVEGGEFMMGATEKDNDKKNVRQDKRRKIEGPAHPVRLSTYSIGETEVTNAMYAFDSIVSNPNKPLANVKISDFKKYLVALNNHMHSTNQIPDDMEFCIPTEAEWEFAARGGNLSKGYLYAGSDDPDEVACQCGDNRNNSSCLKEPCDVASKLPNELGIYDMSGNLSEWVADFFDNGGTVNNYNSHTDYYYEQCLLEETVEDPTGPSTGLYMLRSGSYNYWREESRISCRSPQKAEFGGKAGFRLCLKKKSN